MDNLSISGVLKFMASGVRPVVTTRVVGAVATLALSMESRPGGLGWVCFYPSRAEANRVAATWKRLSECNLDVFVECVYSLVQLLETSPLADVKPMRW